MTERNSEADHGDEPEQDPSGAARGSQESRDQQGSQSSQEGQQEQQGQGGQEPQEAREPHGPKGLPPEEEAAWAEIIAAYGEEPDVPAGPADGGRGGPDTDSESQSSGDAVTAPRSEGPDADGAGESPVRSFTVYAAGAGPRDWRSGTAEGSDEDDEGHFVPPEPPPLPEADTTAKFAWLAVLGGPLLLIFCIVFQVDLAWWIVTLGVGGFLGGFATLVARMRDGRDDDDWDDPGRGAVV